MVIWGPINGDKTKFIAGEVIAVDFADRDVVVQAEPLGHFDHGYRHIQIPRYKGAKLSQMSCSFTKLPVCNR